MAEWASKRFWTETHVVERDQGYGVALDGRPVRTPGKSFLIVPTRALADAIAAEWDAQDGTIDPVSMPTTRAANSAIEKVLPQQVEVADHLAEYGDSDLLCYRTDQSQELAQLQAEAWDPMLDWAATTFGARLTTCAGVIHQPQPQTATAALGQQVRDSDIWQLTALSDLVTLTGSLVLGLAARDPSFDREQLWDLSRVDERFQQQQWGTDDEAEEFAATKRAEFLHAGTFFDRSAQ